MPEERWNNQEGSQRNNMNEYKWRANGKDNHDS
jgi:hypothetical protein